MNLNKTDIINYLIDRKNHFYSAYKVVRIGLFGSFALGTEKEESDIDILIEFEENTTLIYDKKFELREEIEKDLQRSVDLCRVKSIKSAFKEAILSEAIFV
jgi:predicted nucleotidyltransferase